MNGARRWAALVFVAGLLGLSGAQCPFLRPPGEDYSYLPPALPPSPTLQQVIEAVNANAAQIRSFATNDATLSGTGFPALRASVAFERPRRFRLIAGTSVTGPEVDVGSNDTMFWFWIRRGEPAALYYCRHDEFAASPVRRQLAIDPYWLIEAFGIAWLDPAQAHSNPIAVPGGRYEIHTRLETPRGPATKVTVIDGVRAWVLEQRIYDQQGLLMANAATSRFRRDPLSGAFFPTLVEVRVPPQQFAMRLDLASVTVNRTLADPERLWAVPQYPGWPAVNLCSAAQ